MNLRIADTFTGSLARLTGEEQKAVKTTAFDLQMNPVNPGMSFHKLDKARHKNFWSVRVSSDVRLIVHKTADSLLLCYVDHHDRAYQWAERRRLETHPTTGAAQWVEMRERIDEVIVRKSVPAPVVADQPAAKPRLFGQTSDEDLLGWGVPTEWLTAVRLADEDSLLMLADRLPAEAAEALIELATGGTPRRAQIAPAGADPFAHPDAQRRFRVMQDLEELERAQTDASEAAEAKRTRLGEVHVSAFPINEEAAEGSSRPSWIRPGDEPEPEPPFHFDYDYDKHDLTKVATLFGLPKWRVADQCVTWIRTWDCKITHMSDLGGRDRPSGYSRHSRGMDDNYQCYGAYLARHALALVSGQCLATAPISKTRYSHHTWDGWLAGFSPTCQDGLWLSDGTDRYPDFSLHDLMSDDSKDERPVDDPTLLLSLAGVANDGSIGALLTVDGSWSSPDGVRVIVSSALVPTGATGLAVRAEGGGFGQEVP